MKNPSGMKICKAFIDIIGHGYSIWPGEFFWRPRSWYYDLIKASSIYILQNGNTLNVWIITFVLIKKLEIGELKLESICFFREIEFMKYFQVRMMRWEWFHDFFFIFSLFKLQYFLLQSWSTISFFFLYFMIVMQDAIYMKYFVSILSKRKCKVLFMKPET